MSAPGAPPETGGSFSTPEDENKSLFDSNEPVPVPRPRPADLTESAQAALPQPQPAPTPAPTTRSMPDQLPSLGAGPVTTDERFMPGTAPNTVGQLTIPEQLAELQRAPILAKQEEQQQQPKTGPRAALLNPTPIEEMKPRLNRKDQQLPSGYLSPKSFEGVKAPLSGGVPDEKSSAGNPNSAVGRAVDKALGMEGMHEKINRKDIQNYLANGGAGMDPAKTAWCAAFVNATLKYAGAQGSGSQVATSFLNWGDKVTGGAQKGDVVVEPKGRKAGQTGGHVGIATGKTMTERGVKYIEVLSGNLSHKVGTEWVPESDAVVRRMRGTGTPVPLSSVKVKTSTVAGPTPPVPAGADGKFVLSPVVPTRAAGGTVTSPATVSPVVNPEDHPVWSVPPEDLEPLAVDPLIDVPAAAPVEMPRHVLTNKPAVVVPGGYATERSITIPAPGEKSKGFINIPTIVDGKAYTPKEAIELHIQGKNPAVGGPYPTIKEAGAAAKARSQHLGAVQSAYVEGAQMPEDPRINAYREQASLSQTRGRDPLLDINYAKSSDPANLNKSLGPLLNIRDEPEIPSPAAKPRDLLEELNYLATPRTGEAGLKDLFEAQRMINRTPVQGPVSVPAQDPGFSQALWKPALNPAVEKKVEEELAAKSDTDKAILTMKNAVRPLQFMAKGPVKLFGLKELAWSIPEILMTGLAYPDYLLNPDRPLSERSAAHHAALWLGAQRRGEDVFANKVVGLGNEGGQIPRNPIEKSGEILGEAILPARAVPAAAIGGARTFYSEAKTLAGYNKEAAGLTGLATQSYTIPLSVGSYVAHMGVRPDSPVGFKFFSDAQAKPAKRERVTDPNQTFEPAVPGHLEPGTMNVVSLNEPLTAYTYVRPDGLTVLIPGFSRWLRDRPPLPSDPLAPTQAWTPTITGQSITYAQAIRQYNKTGMNLGVFSDEDAANQYLQMMNDRVVKVIPTQGGPGELKASELMPMGIAAGATLGLIFGPRMVRATMNSRLWMPPLGVPIENFPNVRSYSNLRDFMTSSHDIGAIPGRIAERINMPTADVLDMNTLWAQQTRGGANNMGTAAVELGRVRTQSYNFRVPVSLTRLSEAITPESQRFIAHLNELEEIAKREVAQAARPNANPGPVTLTDANGMPRTRADVEADLLQLRTNNPQVVQHASVLRRNNRELLRLEAEGEYSMITPAEHARRLAEEPHRVKYGEEIPINTNPAIAAGIDMQRRIVNKVGNEAKGTTVDMFDSHSPGVFSRPITADELAQNPHWNEGLVTFYRRGEIERRITDPVIAGAMRLNPYMAMDAMSRTFRATTRGFQTVTTGIGNPTFTPVSFMRSVNILRTTAPAMGWQSPGLARSVIEIPRQMYERSLGAITRSLDQQYGNWLGRNFGHYAPATLQALQTRFSRAWMDSQTFRLQEAGGTYGTILEHQHKVRGILDSEIMKETGPIRSILKALKSFNEMVHNAPSSAAARLNFGKNTREDWAYNTRRSTGDPVVGGEYMPGGREMSFHLPRDAGRIDRLERWGANKVNQVMDIARTTNPWHGITVQGAKAIINAYNHNPTKFTLGLMMTQSMPALGVYLWNKSQGMDPQGISYTDYQMNGRSPYNRMMNLYVAKPGQPAYMGMEIPFRYHETLLFGVWAEIFADHLFRNNKNSLSEDLKYAAWQALGIATAPPTPPLFNAILGTKGYQGPQSFFEGDIYKRKTDPFNTNKGLNTNIELVMRAMHGGLADIYVAGLNAMVQGGLAEGPNAFLSQAGRRLVEKTPFARDLLGMHPGQVGNTRIIDEMFKRQAEFKMLDNYFRNYGVEGGPQRIAKKPPSASGGAAIDARLGPIPRQSPGMPQPKPVNPLYVEAMQLLHDRLTKDATVDRKGNVAEGIGFRSLYQRYSIATKIVNTLSDINDGNIKNWKGRLYQLAPDAEEFLEHNRVNTNDPRAVRSFYQQIRQNAAWEITKAFDEVEHELSTIAGRPVKIKDLDPHKRPTTLPDWLPRNETLEHMFGLEYSGTEQPQ